MESKLKTNMISISDAKKWTSKWQKDCPNNCKAFLIPSLYLVEILKEMNILTKQKGGGFVLDPNKVNGNDIRAYMAIDEDVNEGGGEKMLLVGTSKEVIEDKMINV